MNVTAVFVSALLLTGAAAAAAVWYVHVPLRRILVESCGTEERAAFWAAFSNITLILAPLLFALHAPDDPGPRGVFVLALASQLQWGFSGLLLSVVLLGAVLSRFIRRLPVGPSGDSRPARA